jgi:hypothetical protein
LSLTFVRRRRKGYKHVARDNPRESRFIFIFHDES